jgi:integrase
MPKSRRSVRDLPLPAALAAALQELKARQQVEARAFGSRWSDDRLVAVREDGSPIRHEWYSDEFQRLRQRVGLRHIHLKRLRNTSVSLMLAGGIPVHVVAAWHGDDPAVSLSIYSDAQREDLRAAGASAFSADGWPTGSRLGHWLLFIEPQRNKKTRSDTGQSGFQTSG